MRAPCIAPGCLPLTTSIASDTAPGPSYISAPLKRVPSPLPSSSSSPDLIAPPPHYMSLAIRLPHAATSSQRKEGKRGVSIDMIIDTGSTVNVVQPSVASELGLPVVGTQPAGTGAGGGISSAPIFLLGDIQFDHLAPEDRFTVMSGLQAASLNVPSPSSAGILGRPFLDSFEAISFVFSNESQDEIRFHSEDPAALVAGATRSRVKLSTLGVSGLWGVDLMMTSKGGPIDDKARVVVVKALVDTGAPTTIINLAAAEALGLNLTPPPPPPPPPPRPPSSQGLLSGLIGKMQSGLAAKQGPQLQVGVSGLRVSPCPVSLSLQHHPNGVDINKEKVLEDASFPDPLSAAADLGSWLPLIGDLPGFAVLGVEAGEPAAILGLDALRYRGSFVILPGLKEIVF